MNVFDLRSSTWTTPLPMPADCPVFFAAPCHGDAVLGGRKTPLTPEGGLASWWQCRAIFARLKPPVDRLKGLYNNDGVDAQEEEDIK